MKEGKLLAADTDSLTGLLEVLRVDVILSGLLAAAAFSIAIGAVAEVTETAVTKPTFSEGGTTEMLGECLALLASTAGKTCSGWKNGLVS